MSFQTSRLIKVNQWIIKMRWFYLFGILGIGLISKVFGKSNVDFSVFEMGAIALAMLGINIIFLLAIREFRNAPNSASPQAIGFMQILTELSFFVLVMHLAGGAESISMVFFVLPIISASLLFGMTGAIITALASSCFVNGIIVLEHFNIIDHVSRYGEPTMISKNLNIALTNSVMFSLFYFIVGIFSAFNSELLLEREELLMQNSQKLNLEKKAKEEQFEKINKTAKLLTNRDKELVKINQTLDEKIKELNKTKKFLEQEEKKTNAIIDNLTAPIIVFDQDNKLIFLNPATTDILGIGKENIGKIFDLSENTPLTDLGHLIKKEFKSKILKNTGESFKEELNIKEGHKEFSYKVVTVKIITDDNENLGTMKIFYDLTREKMIDKMKTQFISVAAHQLRTPLSAIKWTIKMALDGDTGDLNKEQATLLNKGFKSTERIIMLVNDLLNVSRIEEGRFDYEFDQCDFQEILNNTFESAEKLIAQKHIKLDINKPEDIPKIRADKSRVIMVLQNILENSIKYTPEYGSIKVDVKQKNEYLRISIKDNGMGIKKEDQKKLFTKFFRASNVIKTETEGTGLGLYIAKNIIEKHGGEINIKSEEGAGTEAIFTLPIEKNND